MKFLSHNKLLHAKHKSFERFMIILFKESKLNHRLSFQNIIQFSGMNSA